jgi:TolB protein
MRLSAVLLLSLLAVAAATASARPRNGLISFWSNRSGGRAQVYVMNPDGSGQRQVTNLFSAKRGAWSPDGTLLAFDGRSYDMLFDFDVFLIRPDGTGFRQVTRGPARDTQASWSPDGKQLAFVRERGEHTQPEVWVVGADGTHARRLTNGGSPAWSRDGRTIAVGALARLVAPNGRLVRRLTIGEDFDPAWSPDGRRLFFTRYEAGADPELYLVNATGSGLRRLTRNNAEDFAGGWSPDGRLLLFTSNRAGPRQVFVMRPDGTGAQNVSRSEAADWATSWQPVR